MADRTKCAFRWPWPTSALHIARRLLARRVKFLTHRDPPKGPEGGGDGSCATHSLARVAPDSCTRLHPQVDIFSTDVLPPMESKKATRYPFTRDGCRTPHRIIRLAFGHSKLRETSKVENEFWPPSFASPLLRLSFEWPNANLTILSVAWSLGPPSLFGECVMPRVQHERPGTSEGHGETKHGKVIENGDSLAHEEQSENQKQRRCRQDREPEEGRSKRERVELM